MEKQILQIYGVCTFSLGFAAARRWSFASSMLKEFNVCRMDIVS
jgi:hypothetical protein